MKKINAALLTFLAAVQLASLEWPSSLMNATSVFGQKTDSTVQRGIVLSKTEEVRAAGDGEVLFVMEESSNLSGFPGTLGNAVLVAHEDSLISVYGNLDDLLRVAEAIHVESGAIIGAAKKNPGENEGECFFQVYDMTERITQCFLSIPTQKRRSSGTRWSIANGQAYPLERSKPLNRKIQNHRGNIRHVEAARRTGNIQSDVLPTAETARAPELFKEKEGKLSVGTDIDGSVLHTTMPASIWAKSGYPGEELISQSLRDIAGNERSVQFGLTVERNLKQKTVFRLHCVTDKRFILRTNVPAHAAVPLFFAAPPCSYLRTGLKILPCASPPCTSLYPYR